MTLRWPQLKELRVVVPIAVPFLVLLTFVVRGCATANVPIAHPPPGVTLPPAEATSVPFDLTGVQLAGVDGTTTVAPVRASGTAHLSGGVNGPQGPVPGATVRIEHLSFDHPIPVDVVSGPDGRWDLNGIAGGPYRVHAFMAPTLAQTQPEVFFLGDGEQRNLDLALESFVGFSITGAVAPDPPQLNQPLTFVVRVAKRTVDTNGVVQGQPIVNATVSLTQAQGWSVRGQSTAFTDVNGDAVFALDCKAAGASTLQVTVRATPTDVPQAATLTVSACNDPAATTTTAPASGGPPTSASGPPPN